MASTLSRELADFGTRSVLTHVLMALSFTGAVIAGLFIEGELGLISFVAFVNFAAGLWIAQSIHSLGNAAAGTDYDGVLNEVLDYVG